MYGSKIASIRLARGYSQDYVAKKIGIDQQRYSKIENDGKAKADDDLLTKIADALGVSVEDIKSPTPIVMSFHNSPNNDFIQAISTDHALMETLKQQLQQKDEQLQQKDEQIAQLLALLGKK
jgi:transcriptional regulator with XRE-family HTH domain